MLFSNLEKQIAQKNVKPLYLFLSEDPYLFHRAIGLLEKSLKGKYPRFEKVRWNGVEQNSSQLHSELESFSLLYDHRLIIANSIEKLKDLDFEEIVQIQRNNISSTLVLIAEKKESFRKISKFILDEESWIECVKPSAREILSWVITFAKEEGKNLSLSYAKKIIELVGNDLFSLHQQMKLLALYLGERNEIQSEDIDRLFSEVGEKNVFSLTQFVASNDLESTFSFIRKLFNQGEVPLKLFGLLARHYRILLKIKLALRKKMGMRGIAQNLRLPTFVVEESIGQSQKLNWKKLIEVYQKLEETDLALKSSSLSSSLILEKMLWAILK